MTQLCRACRLLEVVLISKQIFSPIGLASNMISTQVFPQNFTSLLVSCMVWVGLVGLALWGLLHWDLLRGLEFGLLHPDAWWVALKRRAAESSTEKGKGIGLRTSPPTTAGGRARGDEDDGRCVSSAERESERETVPATVHPSARGDEPPATPRSGRESPSTTSQTNWSAIAGLLPTRNQAGAEADLERGVGRDSGSAIAPLDDEGELELQPSPRAYIPGPSAEAT